MNTLEIIKENLLKKEDNLSKYACKSSDAIRLNKKEEDIRPAFFHDTDTIIHSNSYARYMGKTQVYSFKDNDHISKRMLHVQLVSKIARTIGRALNLNEDLIEAIGLGHDIGHTPIGHTGEKILNDLSMKELGIPFMHNLQSVRNYLYIENNGNGSNLTIQVMDGMMCHNGEMLENVYTPVKKSKEDFIKDFLESSKDSNYASKIRPMTLEGCVVRISDVISYIGKDIDDAVRLEKLNRKDIPKEITDVLGSTNGEIVNTLVMDIIENSIGKNYIKMSDDVFNALNRLLKFNYTHIYALANTKRDIEMLKIKFAKLFELYYNQIENKNTNEDIFVYYLDSMDKKYFENSNTARMVIDYIAGMTDDFFNNQYKKYFG